MQKNNENESLKKKLKEELDWYTLWASAEEYDEQAVESILYLLDRWEPLDEDTIPSEDEAWERFQKIADLPELLPVGSAGAELEGFVRRKPTERSEGLVWTRPGDRSEGLVRTRPEERSEGLVRTRPEERSEGLVRTRPEERSEGLVRTRPEERSEGLVRTRLTERSKGLVWTRSEERSEGFVQKKVTVESEEFAQNRPAEGLEGIAQPEALEGFGRMKPAEELEGTMRKRPVEECGEAGNDVMPVFDGENGDGTETAGAGVGRKKKGRVLGFGRATLEDGGRRSGSGRSGGKGAGRFAGFAVRHKIVTAAVLVLMILVAGNTIHAVANPDAGFFFWMKRDDSGVKMITSPEGLEVNREENENIYYNREDLPEWAEWWGEIIDKISMLESYDLEYYDVKKAENRESITGYYLDSEKKTITLGAWVYLNEVLYSIEEFVGYTYIQSYEVNQKQIDVYSRIEDGIVFYIMCFYEENGKYFVRGQDNLEELKVLVGEYWNSVK